MTFRCELNLLKCPNCGGEVGEEYGFCKFCGTKLNRVAPLRDKIESTVEAEVANVITERFDGIKNRNESVVRAIVDEGFNKFDDWPPFRRQEGEETLRNEFGAFKVLSGYDYELKDLQVDVFGDVAVATFHIHYKGEMRNRRFEINSRVTSVLRRQEFRWKIVHEHFSRFPEKTRRRFW